MKKNTKLALIILAIVLVLGVAMVLYRVLGDRLKPNQMEIMPQNTTSDTTPPEESQPSEATESTQETEPPTIPAPDFTVYDRDGNPVKLSDFQGRPVVLNFWASWCGPCRSEMPAFNRLYEELGEHVEFLMINMTDGMRETQAVAEKFVEEQGFTFPVYFDKDQDAMLTYGAYSLPTTYLVDAQGNVAARAIGAIDYETMLGGIDLIYPDAIPD